MRRNVVELLHGCEIAIEYTNEQMNNNNTPLTEVIIDGWAG